MKESRKKDTDVYTYYNRNPKGRITGDCSDRAMSLFLDIPYEQSVMEVAEYQCKTGYALCDGKDFAKYFLTKGIEKHKMPRREDNTRFTVREFCKEIAEPNKRYFILIANHAVCIKENRIHDIWDCSNKSVGNYWVTE